MRVRFAVVLLVILSAVCSKAVQARACSQSPLERLANLPSVTEEDECQTTSDCQLGAQCRYRGCVRKCEFPSPCQQVICKDGYLCEAREKPCNKKPCQLEATCLPESQMRCAAPTCSTELCPPGYERANDGTGCPTCDCVKKPDCEPMCFIFCAYGFQEGPDKCPLCGCKPEPANPCSNVTCGENEECRFMQVTCKRAPCLPVATCVPILQAKYDNACGLTDPTTAGLPVVTFKGNITELDCATHTCPDNTVCTRLGKKIARCCWQHTQEQVLPPPKTGECPPMVVQSEPETECQFDQICPGDQKCCGLGIDDTVSSPHFGSCTNPVYLVEDAASEECHGVMLVNIILTWFGFC